MREFNEISEEAMELILESTRLQHTEAVYEAFQQIASIFDQPMQIRLNKVKVRVSNGQDVIITLMQKKKLYAEEKPVLMGEKANNFNHYVEDFLHYRRLVQLKRQDGDLIKLTAQAEAIGEYVELMGINIYKPFMEILEAIHKDLTADIYN